ncbi:MAG: hypothetical protein Fur0043_05880 [Anaerolineales bacterium]
MTVTISAFSASSMLFLYALMALVLLFSAAAERNSIPTELDALGTSAMLALFFGVYLFLISLALAGWVRSKTTGIAFTIMALGSTCLIALAISAVLSLFAGA